MAGQPPRITLSASMANLHGLAGDGPWALEDFLASYDETEQARLRAAFEHLRRDGRAFDLTVSRLDPDGERAELRFVAETGEGDGRLHGLLCDETKRRVDAWRQQVQNRHLAAIASGRPLAETLESLVSEFESRHRGAIASILLVDACSGRLHDGAGGRLPAAYRAAIDGAEIGQAAGSCGTAAHRRQPVEVRDIATDPLWADYAELALAHGLRACWSTPVIDGQGEVVATFAIYYRRSQVPTRAELADAESLASLVALAIEQSELVENLRQLMDSAVEVICVFDERGHFVTVNQTAQTLWGMSPESLVGKNVAVLVHPEDLERTREAMARVIGGEVIRDFPNRNIAADGRILSMQWSATWSADNRRMYCYGRDVTSQRLAQSRLHLLERAIESSSNGVLISDARAPGQPLLYVNSAMERISGYPRSAFVGRNCRFLQGRDREQPELDRLREAIATGQSCTVVLRNYRRSGELFWNELSLTPVRDDEGTVTHILGVTIDISERRQFEDDLARAMSHDAVTDLPRYSSLGMDQGAQRASENEGEREHRWWLLFIDLDRFHSVNETLGDRVGDLALRQIAARLRDALGGFGRLSRFAGDEFVAVVPDLDSAGIIDLAERLRGAVSRPIDGAPLELCLTTSIGISGYPDHGRSAGELLRRAEAAMTQAKQAGRDAVCLYVPSSMQDFEDRLALGVHLRGAAHRDELELHYQPQIAIDDGRLLGFEALVRWSRAPMGPVPPARFIPIAEALGLMPEVGQHVLRMACAQLRCWRDTGLPCVRVAVNVSAQQLLRADFAQAVEALLSEYELPAELLQIELTESSLMESVDRVRSSLDRLRECGVSLALDDFGTGYSSLSYLKRFAFDKLKIDRSFVADLSDEGSDAAIVRTIISVGHQLGMKVSAEGVETPAQLQVLRALGCDELQGYLLGRPQPASTLEVLLRDGRVAMPEA